MKLFEDMTAAELAAVITRWTGGMYRRDVVDRLDARASREFREKAIAARRHAIGLRPGLLRLQRDYQYLRGFYE